MGGGEGQRKKSWREETTKRRKLAETEVIIVLYIFWWGFSISFARYCIIGTETKLKKLGVVGGDSEEKEAHEDREDMPYFAFYRGDLSTSFARYCVFGTETSA